MRFRADDRGASMQVGAILLFGSLIVLLAFWQAQVVPSENAAIEYDHNRRVQDDMQAVRSAIVSAPGRSSPSRSVAIELAPSYPPRVLFVNPGRTQGTIETVATANASAAITVRNASALDAETADYWNGSNRTFNTGGLAYEPGYAEYGDAPVTIYENSVLYNRFSSSNVTRTGQALIDGRSIRLVALNGSLDETRSGSYTLDVRSVSSSTRAVAVTNESGNVTVVVPTRLPASTWRELLDGEFVENGSGHVVGLRTRPTDLEGIRLLAVELEPGVTYELQLAKVGVGRNVTDEDAHYVTDVVGNGSTIATSGSQQLVVEVRDRFDNPESGVQVNVSGVSGDAGGSVTPADATTGDDGRASFTYVPSSAGTAEITLDVSASPAAREAVTFVVEVSSASGDGGGAAGGTCDGPTNGSAYNVCWLSPAGQAGTESPCDDTGCVLNASESLTLDLTMAAGPSTADTPVDAPVDYAVNDTAVGTLSPWSDTTNSIGENTTTFTAAANGTARVYAASGGSGDVINVTVVAFPLITYVDEFDDDDGAVEPSENESLPGGTAGDVEQFANAMADNGSSASFVEADTDGRGCCVAYNLDVSTAVRDVPAGNPQEVGIKYRTNTSLGDNETYVVEVVHENGTEVDPSTTYTLTATGGDVAERTITLSASESRSVSDAGVLYLVWEDANADDGSQTHYDVFYVRVLTPVSGS